MAAEKKSPKKSRVNHISTPTFSHCHKHHSSLLITFPSVHQQTQTVHIRTLDSTQRTHTPCQLRVRKVEKSMCVWIWIYIYCTHNEEYDGIHWPDFFIQVIAVLHEKLGQLWTILLSCNVNPLQEQLLKRMIQVLGFCYIFLEKLSWKTWRPEKCLSQFYIFYNICIQFY